MRKYLEFKRADCEPKRKTKVFHIFNVETGQLLGEIKWSRAWRQYVSRIELGLNEIMDFTAGCHREVANFIEGLMDERRKIKKEDSE